MGWRWPIEGTEMIRMTAALLLAALLTAALGPAAAHAQGADQAKLAEIDRSFVCPEAMPTDQTRHDALSLFMHQAADANPQGTVEEIVNFRTWMLQKHHCKQGDTNLFRPAAPAKP
jgi:hypothetical protein